MEYPLKHARQTNPFKAMGTPILFATKQFAKSYFMPSKAFVIYAQNVWQFGQTVAKTELCSLQRVSDE